MASIAVDIDDTLYSFTDEAREQLSLMIDEPEYEPYSEQLQHALYANWNQWRTPFELCGFDADGNSLWLAVIDRCHDSDAILRQQPFVGAVEVTNELVEAGHKLVYISNRATETEEATQQWLTAKGFPVGELVVTSGDKGPYLRECQYMIDDRVKNVIDFMYDLKWTMKYAQYPLGHADDWELPARHKRQAFVRVTDFNNGLTDVKGLWLAHTWAGLRRYMVKVGLLEGRVPAHA